MERTPTGIDLSEVIDALSGLEGVRNVHHVHAWALSSGRQLFSAHLGTDAPGAAANDDLLIRAHDLLRDRFGFYFVTLQIGASCLDETAAAAIDVTQQGTCVDPVTSRWSRNVADQVSTMKPSCAASCKRCADLLRRP